MEMFIPVVVNGGRKFRGEGYQIPGEYVTRWGYAGSGVAPLTFTTQVKIWDPKTGTTSYVNERFVDEREVSEEQKAADLAKYADGIITSTVEWCRGKSVGKPEAEVLKFAHNVIRKHHADLVPAFEAKYGFKVDVAEVVMSTISWAFGLGYRSDKAVRIAFRALTKKGLVGKDGFNAAWHINLDLRGAGKYADKYAC